MSAPAPAAPATAATSATPPSTPRRRPPLGFADVANIFVKMRRASNKAKAKASTKPWHIHSSSGAEPQSHPGALEGASELRQPLQHRDVFICHDAVNAGQLLRATRNVLVEEAEFVGANALVDEQWDCTICGPKHRRNGTFKVEILYSASATQSDRADPHRPVALDKIKGVPGLMTVTKRIP
ncbi:hypothetical protein GGX14DRAFT_363037 [Mycena pura]|uniref:Uncharacterized protein n=1 Tax=Mycena pura TaxID=153505 RepID=A0AAD6VH72_9AGAR|nr:hypothetical protein GGX14DRAFT_363037 [Mycena pura]